MYRLGIVLVSLVALTACGGGGRRAPVRDSGPPSDGAPPPPPGTCSAGGPEVVCQGLNEIRCNPSNGSVVSTTDCSASSMTCAPGIGCAACQPGRGSCTGNTPQICRADGSGYDAGSPCADGLTCNPSTGVCADLCAEAVASNSYIGCEYFATVTTNAGLETDFQFAVVVANPQTVPAQVQVTRGTSMVASQEIPGGGLVTIPLSWVDQLKNSYGDTGFVGGSTLVTDGAYKVTSNVPVTVYQFNPLEYELSRDCTGESALDLDGVCNSYTNDASLLLPTHVLTGNYMVVAFPSALRHIEVDDLIGGPDEAWITTPGFFSITGTEDGTTVEITFASHVRASTGGTSISAFTPGQTGNFTLNEGDVLQILSADPPTSTCAAGSPQDRDVPLSFTATGTYTYCEVGDDYDLTGSVIHASAPVSVVAGHDCSFVPRHRWACDHLEEAIFPLETWGKDMIVGVTQPVASEPNVVRVVSSRDGNSVTFDPAVRPNLTMSAGEVIEFETTQDFRVTGTEAILVAQFMVGQNYAGIDSAGTDVGDPSMGLAIPTEQFRSEYTFLAPGTFTQSYVNVTAQNGQEVMLDGAPVTGWRMVSGTGMQTARVPVSSGTHSMESATPFGIVVYGHATYTSYLYPGGLDLEVINLL